MQPLTTCLLYLSIGIVSYPLLFKVRPRLCVSYRVFFIAAPIIAVLSLSVGYLHVIFGDSAALLVKYLLLASNISGNGLYILLGYCLSGIVFKLITKQFAPRLDEQCILIIRGLSIVIGLTFISAGFGKIFGFSFMVQFFIQSGYTKSFLFFIMVLEVTSGMILLFNIRFYLKIAALTMLLSDMSGAVITHIRNHDPLADSGSAILLGFKLLISLGVYLLVHRIRNRHLTMSNTYDTKKISFN